MGFLDRFTGGSGNIQMQLSKTQLARGESLAVSFTVTANDHLKSRGIHLQIIGEEEVKYQAPDMSAVNTALSQATSGNRQSTSAPSIPMIDQTKQNQTYQHDDILDGNTFELQKGETRSYSGTVNIPANAAPTYSGTDARHTWTVRAYVDVPMGGDVEVTQEILVI